MRDKEHLQPRPTSPAPPVANSSANHHHQSPSHRKPIRLRNLLNQSETFDLLHQQVVEPTQCTEKTCMGSIMSIPGRSPTNPRTKEEVLRLAREFMDQYFASIRRLNSAAHQSRWAQVCKEVDESLTYQLTNTELVYGAKLAWRNSSRCIGRIQWSKLQVFDCRGVTSAGGMFEAICNHIKYSTNKGNIRSAITIFPQRTDGKHDFRVWNMQLISYAGYKELDGTITGDPVNVEFTEVCTRLGWKGKHTRFDILPLVLSANGHDPEYFDIPPDLVMEIPLTHPTFDWFGELGLRWYCVPAVSGMLFDCGGLEFTACPFNGWYMGTEIGCRDLCDSNRYNITEVVATHMGLDTRNPVTLWKDKALVEVNVAVLHSFQLHNATIVDHHTASESFLKHMDNEQRLRRGCPADWVWIVPPMSSSITPVFHQEMALYYLKPSYEYQEPAWKTHEWKKGRDSSKGSKSKPSRKFHFKQIARAVKFTSKLFGRALSRRIKATVLYATETGRSEMYAKKLGEIFGHAFNAQVYCMQDYDMSSVEHEALLLVVTSTFGNGDPPENGEVENLFSTSGLQAFAQNLYAMKMDEASATGETDSISRMGTSKSFIKANSQVDTEKTVEKRPLDRLDSLRGSVSDVMSEDNFGPLNNVRFSVFALGSSAYPNYCAFGKYVDNLLGELGGERLMKLATGDELCGQEQAFRDWAREVFTMACETFCLDDDASLSEATKALRSENISSSAVRFADISAEESLVAGLTRAHNKKVNACKVLAKANLHGEHSPRATMLLELACPINISYQPGDHVGVFPCNRPDLVNGLLDRLRPTNAPPNWCDKPVQLQTLSEKPTPNGLLKSWDSHPKLSSASIRTLFSRYLDITTPPAPSVLRLLAATAKDEQERIELDKLASDSGAYEDWRHWRYPHLLEVLQQFPSCQPDVALLASQLSPLQPRFYSISSSPRVHPGAIHITVAVVSYKAQGGNGPTHYGVCSNYLKDCSQGELLHVFVRSAPGFHMPEDPMRPIIMVGPGTGIAPFRGFWEHRRAEIENGKKGMKAGPMWLFFGCRNKELDLYSVEKNNMLKANVLQKVFLALSRETTIPKTYVQDLIRTESAAIYKQIVVQKGHFYVCGDCTMAEHVYRTLKEIIKVHGGMTDASVETYMLLLRDENRYHEDIFGITLRTAEVHSKSRESARMRMASQP
ncbi:nitric oxide synthase-like protein isoform X3 [Neocloeon triangulifer]|uniref:nitric oxide synthase-like protein isoform X3 n=1 Tax=Neocloeon triangulifer TaxID=2078957 RepID=UPI00286F7B0B|nr:nitric oxide synthase-like protein isoform X3 [Neocloeon triangulifer]